MIIIINAIFLGNSSPATSSSRNVKCCATFYCSTKTTQSSRLPSLFLSIAVLLTSNSWYRNRLPNLVIANWLWRIRRRIWVRDRDLKKHRFRVQIPVHGKLPVRVAVNSYKFSPGAPTPKRPQVEMSYGKRRARRRKGAGAKAQQVCHRCGEEGGATAKVSGVRFNEERNKHN